MSSLQRFAPPSVARGDVTGRAFQTAVQAEQSNEKARALAIGAINDNQSLRYITVPGSSTPWPIPLSLWEILPAELR